MNERTSDIRDIVLLSLAVILGLVLAPEFSLVGLPLAAMGIGGLAYRGRTMSATSASVIAIALTAVLQASNVVFAIPAAIAVFAAVVWLPRIDAQWVGAMLTAVIGAAGAGRDYVVLKAEGTTVTSLLSTEINKLVAQNAQSAGSAASAQAMRETASMLLSLVPMMYFLTGLATAVAVLIAIAWAAKRSGRTVKVPMLSRLDFTPHVLWPFIIGVFALAASYAPIAQAPMLRVVGLNLVLCMRALFALQGFGVASGVLDRAGVGLGGRILGLAALAALDVFTLSLSFIGLLDFWVNFRRLPRDGVTPSSPATAAPDR